MAVQHLALARNPLRIRGAHLGLLAAAGLLAVWSALALSLVEKRGLFGVLGFDYGVFWAAARALASGHPTAAYDLDALARYVQPLTAYTPATVAGAPLVLPAPYPPLFFLLLSPLTTLDPVAGFVLWTLLNLVPAVYVLHQLARRFGRGAGAMTAILSVFFFPLVQTLLLGQLTGLILFGFYQTYRGLERGQDLRAGVWIGVLLLKPQYALVLVLVLLLKRRWSALLGIASVGALCAVSAVALLGLDGLATYLASMRSVSGFRLVSAGVHPEYMISWRGLLVNLLPDGVSEAQGVALTLVLSVASLCMLPLLWRGRWNPHDGRFAARMLATMVITMLVSFHNHAYGAILLVVPGMALAAGPDSPRLTRLLLWVGAFVPSVLFLATGSLVIVGLFGLALMLLTLADLCVTGQVLAFGRE